MIPVFCLALAGCDQAPPVPPAPTAIATATAQAEAAKPPAIADQPPPAAASQPVSTRQESADPPQNTNAAEVFAEALTRYGSGDTAGAVAALEAAIGSNRPVEPEMALPLAMILIDAGRLPEARLLLERVVAHPGAASEHRLLLGEVIAAQAAPDAASATEAVWASLPADLPVDLASRLAIARVTMAIRAGDATAAMHHHQSVSPAAHPDLHRRLGLLLTATTTAPVDPETPIPLARHDLLLIRLELCDREGLASATLDLARQLADAIPPDDPDPRLQARRERAIGILTRPR